MNIDIRSIFTKEELKKAGQVSAKEFSKTVLTDDKLKYINEITRQENDRLYLAYLAQYVGGRING